MAKKITEQTEGAGPAGKAQLQAMQRKTLEACAAEVRAVLEKHGCALVGIPGLAPDGTGGYRIVTKVDVQIAPGE